MTAFTFRMPAGIPGDPNRAATPTIEAQNVTPTGTTGAPTAYGVALVVDQTGGNVGNMRTVASGDTSVYGLLVRPFPTQSSQDPLGTSTPPGSGPIDVMVRGYMSVLLSGGSIAAYKGAPVYVWAGVTSGTHVIGGWEASSAGASALLVSRSYFMGPADANGVTEIAFNI